MQRVVLIGLGMVAATHAAAIAATDGRIILGGVLSTTPERAARFAENYAANYGRVKPQVYESHSDVAADPEIDFVIICTPPNARQEIVTSLAAARKPVLTEKPLERTLDAAEKIVATCADAGVPLGVVFQHRMRASSRLLSGFLQEGRFGQPAVCEIAVPWWRPQSYYDEPGRGSLARDGGGVLISQAIHTLDLALSLLGPVRAVQAMARTTRLHQMETEDFVSAGLDFGTGTVGSLVASTASFPGGSESITLHCDEASVRLQAGQLHINWRNGETEVLGEAGGTGGGADPMAFTHEWHQSVIEDFADAVAERRPPAITGQDALAVQRLIDALIRSSQTGQTVSILDGA